MQYINRIYFQRPDGTLIKLHAEGLFAELSNEEILQIDELIEKWALPARELGVSAHKKEGIPSEYLEDKEFSDIFTEYYNGILNERTATEMRKICLPKYIRRAMNKKV